ncbi:MAG: stage II sporulation protein M [Desulfatitalea sp.]|nr:stage II sporulation protein M [Desulfatitalea sp.]NNK00583.1 stage II sporulation protein M [Desulfatitalea sp.]
MIIDLKKFIATEQPFWRELEQLVVRQEADPYRRMPFREIKRLHYLYHRASADLAKINTYSAELSMRLFLESLVGRAYGVIYGAKAQAVRFAPLKWFWNSFPRTFRRRWQAFALSAAVMLLGSVFGGGAIVVDPHAKAVLMPFEHLQMDPSERVAKEERMTENDRLAGGKSSFSAFLMTHNTRISILVLALGMTFGVGTVLLLFSNGVMLGAVAADYIQAGESTFLVGWLLPHGATEIPAILVAGQAGLLLAAALLGYAPAKPMGERLRETVPDVVTLMGGVTLLLIWAGLVEAFFSQYHEPVIPYGLKIAFGSAVLLLLILFLTLAGKSGPRVSRRRRANRLQRRKDIRDKLLAPAPAQRSER